ncbi:PaaX family transcriptional regulator [Leucobacter sp. M11]|uniref:PaaX family transcriptional regulator n=1 Tax=Leucobacter sp. M11 TaxID=2993565 RepID=UPI002D7E2F7F|nr:PaaX family transcriptional regulator [Leucobacter sp. M11]MEB4613658.1 PaaX family transcriptional regulator [Leucobacter sp. M11]
MSPLEIAPRTVIEACFDADGVAELSIVYDVANAVGLPDQPVRIAIRRLEAAGILAQEGRGRKGRLVLTEQGRTRERVDQGHLALLAAQDAGEPTWDGLWHLFTFTVPEKHRSERDALRSSLVRLGAAPLAQGVYVSPFSLSADVAAATIDRYLITAEATRLSGPGLGRPEDIAETLWPAAGIEAAYVPLTDALAEAATLPETAELPERLGVSLRLAEALTYALERDPLIPPELREEHWQPPAIRTEFRRTWVELQRGLPAISLFRPYAGPGGF